MIKLEHINKFYKLGSLRFQALKDVNLTIKKGEFIAVQGKSGAGKSTLLHILGCLDRYDSGTYMFDGIDIASLSDRKKAKVRNEKIGFVMQDFSLINHKKVSFNVMLPLFFNRTPNKKMREMAFTALQAVDIVDQADKKANQLSGGQRQRAAIARAIVNNPAVVLADEPTGALDAKTSKDIMELLKKLNQNGMTIIVVTHDEAVASYCDRKIVISDGIIQNQGIQSQ